MLENMEPLTTLFRNVRQAIPLHFDHVNLLMVNLIFLYGKHNVVLKSARNSLVKASRNIHSIRHSMEPKKLHHRLINSP